MPKFTKQEREQILESVIQAEIMRFSLEETIKYVKEKTDCEISISYLS